MKNHGGLIEADSRQNEGSVFTVWLPADGKSALPPCTTEAPSTVRKGRVLVMDDEEMVRDSVGEMLETLGQDVEFSSGGAAAIEAYREAQAAGTPFSVVILDATVKGGMGGEDVIKKLREIDPDVVAVISSGYSDNALIANYNGHGFKAFLPKPYTLENLQAVLGSVMNPSTSNPPASAGGGSTE
jgi:CheY-like chemotaxis protein